MPDCPAGLTAGFGIDPPAAHALCSTRTYFGMVDGGDLYLNGTGWLFRTAGGAGMVATAAHNLYHPRHGLHAQSIEVNFGRNGGTTVGQRQMRERFLRQEFVGTGAPEWDYGVIAVDTLPTADFPPIALRQATTPGGSDRLLFGYPDEGDCKNRFEPYHAGLTVFPLTNQTFGYRDLHTYAGMSGGPLLGRVGNAIVSYGIHVRGPAPGNPEAPRAVRFTASVLNDMLGWG